jgi:anti-sigma factor RsiW
MNDQHEVTCCSHRELAVAWALHALEPVEESLVAAHLPDCRACASIAAETEEIGALLGLAAPQMSPSVELELRILGIAEARPAAPAVPLALAAQLAQPITQPSEVDFRGWLSVTWADVVGHAGVEQALQVVGNSRIG